MLLLRSASRACLRAFLLTSVVLFAGLTNVYADTVNLSFTGVSQWNPANAAGNSLNGGAGRFNWNVSSPVGTLATSLFPANKAWTFCIELGQHAGATTYNVVDKANLSTLPIPGGGMGANRANALQALASLMSYDGSFFSTYTAPTVQAAVWNIATKAGDTDADLFNYTLGSNGTVVAANVEALLDAVLAHRDGWLASNTAMTFFYGLSKDNLNNGQDQIILADGGGRGFGGNVLPVPAGVVMAGMGVVCLGGFNLLRRRRKVAVV